MEPLRIATDLGTDLINTYISVSCICYTEFEGVLQFATQGC